MVRAQCRVGHGGDHVEGDPRRRPLCHHRPEDLVEPRELRRLGLRPVPHRPRVEAAQGVEFHPVRPQRPGGHAPPDPPAPRRSGLCRAVLRRSARAGREPHRGRRRRVERRDGDRGLRARADAAFARAVPGRRRTPRRVAPQA